MRTHAMPLPPTWSTLGSGAMPNTLATHSAPVQIHFSPCHILVLISRTSSPLPNNRSHPAGPSIGSCCQHLKVIIPNLWHPGVYSYIMMGKTTCPQRQRTFLRCFPICFGGAAHFGPNSEWQAGNFFFFCNWNKSFWESLGVIKQIQLGEVPLCTVLVAPALPASLLVPDCVSGGCLFVLERLGWGD